MTTKVTITMTMNATTTNTTDIEMIHFKTLFLLFVEFIVEKHCRIHEYNNDNNEYSSSDGSAAEK